MGWVRLGRIFDVDKPRFEWMTSHAANPCAVALSEDRFRIFFSTRDSKNRSSVGFFDLNLSGAPSVEEISGLPVLSPGVRGSFDEDGVSVGSIFPWDGQLYLFYLGWNVGTSVPFRNAIGRAILSPDLKHSSRVETGPCLDRSSVDPFSLSYPFVWSVGGQLVMYYSSISAWGNEWATFENEMHHAVSKDLRHWTASSDIVVPKLDGESAVSRPVIEQEDGKVTMWLSAIKGSYHIGYAQSEDGKHFVRGVDPSLMLMPGASDWENEMVCYPWIFRHSGVRYLLYCGNGYGRGGIGLARWNDD